MKDKSVYFIGIEGAGTSGLAQICQFLGYQVSGSDIGDHFYRPFLEKKGIKVYSGFSEKNLPASPDLVVYSTAFSPKKNKEIQAAKKQGFKVLPYPQALGYFFNQKKGIAVCGSHGKTTTSAWIAFLLQKAKKEPLALIGGKVVDFGGNNVLLGKGDFFVLEADEYQNKLQYYQPKIVVLNNIDYDHPDFYPDFASYVRAFADFCYKLGPKDYLIVNKDDKEAWKIAQKAKAKVISFGSNKKADFYFLEQKGGKIEIFFQGKSQGIFSLKLFGKHNFLNALAVMAIAKALSLPFSAQKAALEEFRGIQRRLEFKGKIGQESLLYDDYAHHPREIAASLNALRKKYPSQPLWCVFHPHSYSRTEALLKDFAQELLAADKVIILDIYGSVREKSGKVSSCDLVNEINRKQEKALYCASQKEAKEFIRHYLPKRAILVTMGAGDVWQLADSLIEK